MNEVSRHYLMNCVTVVQPRHETPPSSAMMSYPGSEPIPIFGIIVGGYQHLEQADRDIADQLREAKSKER